MATASSVRSGSGSTISLLNAPDATIGDEHAERRSVQALHLRLAADIVRDLQKASHAGKPIQLHFGAHPLLQFDDHKLPLNVTKSPFRHELYDMKAGTASSIQEAQFVGLVGHRLVVERADQGAASALAAADKLKEQMRSWQQDRDSNGSAAIGIVNGKKLSRAALAKSSITQSLPSSPAFPPASSRPDSASMPVREPNKATRDRIDDAQRRAFLHTLAIEPLTLSAISRKTRIPERACRKLVDKYCDENTSERLTLVSRAYRDFDLVNLKHAPPAERQKAVDHAIQALDRMRIPQDDKLWQKLLPVEARGKGKCLSKLSGQQTSAADKVPADHRKWLAGAGGEPMARSTSSDNVAKAKKPTEREKQAKRLLGSKKSSAISTPKQAPTKVSTKSDDKPKDSKVAGQKRKLEAKPLSAEFIEDSDEEVKEADEHMRDSRKKLKTSSVLAKPLSKSSDVSKTGPIPAKAAPKPVKTTTANGSPMAAGSPNPTTTPKKSSASTKLATAAKPQSYFSPSKKASPTLLRKAPAASSGEAKKTGASGTVKNTLKSMAQPRKISSGTAASSSAHSHRSQGSMSSLASSTSVGSLKRPSSSSQDEAPPKKQRLIASPNGSASSPLASSASSSSSGGSHQVRPAARMPELPPRRDRAQSATLRETKLSELHELHSKVLSEYLQLRMKAEDNPTDTSTQAKLTEKSSEYDFLSNEVASLSGIPKSELPIPAATAFPPDSAAYFRGKYDESLPRYNKMRAETTELSPQADKRKLWELNNRLMDLKRLQHAAERGESLVKQQALIAAAIRTPPPDVEVPTRKRTLEQYKSYHQLFAAWSSFRETQRRNHPTYPHLPPDLLREDSRMYARLCDLQRPLLAGFERMRRAFNAPPAGLVATADGDALSARDAELLAWKTRSRLREWADRYDAVFSRFGDCTGAEMDELWALQRELLRDQRAVLRAVALDFGRKEEGKLEDVGGLEGCVVTLGKIK